MNPRPRPRRPPAPVLVCCPYCRGAGRVELAGVYLETLDLLRQQGEVNGAALARRAGCKATAMCNRLARLEALGLAVGRRHGRERLWRPADDPHRKEPDPR